MATGHFFKTYLDVGAPAFSNTAGAWIAILDWALDVSGALYWEKVYSGTNKAVYRSKTGIRPYLRVDDSDTGSAVCQMYETMTDVDTGTGVCPDGINQATNSLRFTKSYDAGPNAYYIVGDAEFFYGFAEIDDRYRYATVTPQNFRAFGFGELASYLALDNYPCVLLGTASTAGGAVQYNSHTINLQGSYGIGDTYPWTDQSGYGDPNRATLYWLKTADGVKDSSGGYVCRVGTRHASQRMSAENPMWYFPHYIQDSAGAINSLSTAFWGYGNANAVTRGRLPYVYCMPVMPTATYGGPDPFDTITVGASEFMYVYSYPSTGAGLDLTNFTPLAIRISNDEPDRP